MEKRLEEIAKLERSVTESVQSEQEHRKVTIPQDAAKLDGHHYMVFYGRVPSWQAAKQKCEEMDGHLATIASPRENAFLMSLIRLPKAEFLLIGGVRAEGQVA